MSPRARGSHESWSPGRTAGLANPKAPGAFVELRVARNGQSDAADSPGSQRLCRQSPPRVITELLMAESLTDQFQDAAKRSALVADCLKVLGDEVSAQTGLGGMAVKTAFQVVKGIKPGFIQDVIVGLLPEFLEKVDPVYQSALEQGLSPGGLIQREKSAVASALLSVTDRKAERASSDLVKKTYRRLRPMAQKHVEAAAPRLGGLLDKHAAAQ